MLCLGGVHIYVCVSVKDQYTWECAFTFMRVGASSCVSESLVLHNSDTVCNILQSLDCLFIADVQ